MGCRLSRSCEWAARLLHEKRFHTETSFITLTYDKEHLPKDGSLQLDHFQKFMKKLRKELHPKKIRFFHAGEYGEKKGRPHYHAIIFGHDFYTDRIDVQTSDRGDETWLSPVLNRLWTHGTENRIGAVTFESCAYVARYCTKKINGRQAESHYERICEVTGEITRLKPEYATMSRRPGIGAEHFHQLHSEMYPSDEMVMRGHVQKPAKFYDRMLAKHEPVLYEKVKEERECALSLSPVEERSPHRLAVKEVVMQAKIGHLSRRYEIA